MPDARFRMVDLSGAILRDVDLSGAEIDGLIDGLVVNGVEVAPLIAAEMARREPARALAKADDPAGLQAAWAGVQERWAATYERVAGMPPETVDVSVEGEWSFAQTLRHLVMATDTWLGAIRGDERPFHPWGLPFTEITDFVDPAELGLDLDATPSYAEVLEMRADRVARVRDFLAGVTEEQLDAPALMGPIWARDKPVSVRRCVRVIINEEWEHRRFAERDLDAIAASRR